MNTQVKIPQGDEKVTVELTRKELMSLAGIRFHGNHNIEVSARKKLHDILESQESAARQLLN
ncbi:hypothetical protein [Paenibacillus sacheonensis]|uniref:Uncharacterized protein n=1 Tax=Paenibacillus sacheonensis TaxID=742054 RepID=A0A7X4YU02_9BACL|nr:hypothetical protein [Paenibacillus sacheonensis]MBM7566892.1 hypothetical protein [Paenibacillus sacheonensis]NBC71514.1 hypothetical protein [Paenibacillus sacheonensis]